MASRAQLESYLTAPTVKAFLDTVAWAEGANYNTLYGGGTFSSYSWHPLERGITAGNYTSTAAGRYQFLRRTWNGIAQKLGLSDFSPRNQDIGALGLIDERGELSNIINGNIEAALHGLGCLWASLPFSGCGQKEKSLSSVLNYYNGALRVYGSNQVVNSNNNAAPTINSDDNTALYIIGGLLLVGLLI